MFEKEGFFFSAILGFFLLNMCLVARVDAQDSRAPNAHYFMTSYTSVEYGQGSSGVSSDNPHSGIFHNPATVGLRKVYSFDGGYIENGNGFTLSVSDGQNELAGAGLGYVQMKGRNGVTLRRVPLSVGKQILEHLSIGSTMNWIQAGNKDTWQTDVGVWVLLARPFSIGVVGKNLLGAPEEFAGRTAQLGFRYQLPIPVVMHALFGRDFQRTKTIAWAFGMETALPYNLMATGGIRQTGYEGLYAYWSSGLGYVEDDFGVHVAYEQALKNAKNSSFFISLTYTQ